jgi:hypothetical protein
VENGRVWLHLRCGWRRELVKRETANHRREGSYRALVDCPVAYFVLQALAGRHGIEKLQPPMLSLDDAFHSCQRAAQLAQSGSVDAFWLSGAGDIVRLVADRYRPLWRYVSVAVPSLGVHGHWQSPSFPRRSVGSSGCSAVSKIPRWPGRAGPRLGGTVATTIFFPSRSYASDCEKNTHLFSGYAGLTSQFPAMLKNVLRGKMTIYSYQLTSCSQWFVLSQHVFDFGSGHRLTLRCLHFSDTPATLVYGFSPEVRCQKGSKKQREAASVSKTGKTGRNLSDG